MSSQKSDRLPFEPNKKGQKPKTTKTPLKPDNQKRTYTKDEMAVPQVVSQRMLRRVAGFCGIPTALGICTLIVSYLLVIYAHIKLAPAAVLLVNMGLFGLGVLGITYGVLSASWDTETAGSLLGWNEFTTNFGRMVAAWRETRRKDA